MKNSIYANFAAILMMSGLAMAQQQGLPPVEELPLPEHRPIAEKMASDLAPVLNFSTKQKNRVEKSLRTEVDLRSGQIDEQYNVQAEQARRYRYKVNDIRYQLYSMRNNLPDIINALLQPAEREKFEKLVYSGYFGRESTSVNKDPLLPFMTEMPNGDRVIEVQTRTPSGDLAKKTIILRAPKKAPPAPKAVEPKPEEKKAPELEFEGLFTGAHP